MRDQNPNLDEDINIAGMAGYYYKLRQIGIEHIAITQLGEDALNAFLAIYDLEQQKKEEEAEAINNMKNSMNGLMQ